MKNNHRGIFPMYNTGLAVFFTIAVMLVIILVNIGFSVTDIQKKVVDHAVDEVDERFVISGKISAAADVSSNNLLATATPVRTASDGSVNVDSEIMNVSYKLVQLQNYVISYDDIYIGSLSEKSYNSLREAVKDAKIQGMVDINPFVDEQKPTTTTAFVYWIINQNFDNYVDNNELAALAIIYADRDRPSSGELLFIEAYIPAGYVLQINENVPNISSETLSFGGVLTGS